MPDNAKHSFVTQGGWMVIATFIGGAAMYAVHVPASQMPKPEYGVLGALIQMVNLMAVPALGLQTAFAQHTASAHSDLDRRQLCGAARRVMAGVLIIWALTVVVLFAVRGHVLDSLGIVNPMALWMAAATALGTMLLPIFGGLLQGRQDFYWLGWVTITNGLGRFSIVMLCVVVFGGYAAGGMSGVFAGCAAATIICAWRAWPAWSGATAPIDWKLWLARVVPLTAGWGVSICMASADGVIVQAFFDKTQTAYYQAAGMIGRALVFFAVPLGQVLFPKVVAAKTHEEARHVLWQALTLTGGVVLAGCVFCTVFRWLPIRMIQGPTFILNSAPLVPWFVWCMLPLALVNVLVNFLLAKRCWRALPVLIAIVLIYLAVLYALLKTGTLTSFVSVVQIIGVFNVILLAVSALFVWWRQRQDATRQD